MKEFRIIKKEFDFLIKEYGFRTVLLQKSGTYCFVDWTNSIINIKVMYDLTDDKPVSILTYDANSLGTVADVTIYQENLFNSALTPTENIHCAAEWLKSAIIKNDIVIA